MKYNEALQTGNVYNIDCLDFSKNILKNTNFIGFDLVLVNTPIYNDKQTIFKTQFDYNQWLEERLTIFPKLLNTRGNLIVYTNEKYNFFIRNILRKLMIEKKSIIWVKKSNTTSINPNLKTSAIKTLINGHEQILWYAKASNYIFNQKYSRINFSNDEVENTDMLTDVWTDIKPIDNDKYTKPEKLSDRLVRIFSYNGIVYLPFGGSGNEIVSCMKNRKKWISTEPNMHIIESIINPKIVDRKNIIENVFN